MLELNFFSDPAHGWLEVPLNLVKELNLGQKITKYSYVKGDFAYLEEDQDAPAFMREANQKGIFFTLSDIFHENSPIRNFRSFSI
jgi:hypothetical protein